MSPGREQIRQEQNREQVHERPFNGHGQIVLDKYYRKILHKNVTRQIEFDPIKDAKNWAKHKLRLATAALVFADPMRIERIDDSSSNTSGEERWQTLGKVGGVLFVVYTERGEKIRLISARPATKAEKRSYYGFDPADSKRWTSAD
ncbi:MAG: BrnT family toxin [Desulfovibrio sp.]|jgi:uncharacterized DUF497 family protein|nr:BrnT family toxin [Desulfovibrio sp.]